MAKKKKDAELLPEGELSESVEPKEGKKKKAPKEKKSRAKTSKKSKKEKGSRLSKGIASPVRNLIFTTIASVLLGVAFFLKPYEVSLYLGYGAGGLLGLVGIVYILIYFLRKPVSGEYRSEFVIGLVALLAGAYVALSGFITSTGGVGYVMIVRVLGILIAADGLLKVQYAVDIGRMKFRAWWVALILAVLSIGIGVLTATDFSGKTITASTTAPVSLMYTLGGSLGLGAGYGNYAAFYGGIKMLGLGFILNGVLDLATLIIIAIRNRKADRAEAIAEASAMIAETKKEEIALPAEAPVLAEPEQPAEPEEVVIAAEPAPELMPDAMPEPVFTPGDPALEQPALATPMDE